MAEFEPEGIKIHEAANIFPMMDPASYASLRDSIKNGGVETLIKFRGDSWVDAELLDGRNRLKAMLELGISWKTYAELSTVADIPDPVEYVVKLNLIRRHLNESQRAMVAARVANLPRGQPGSNGADAPLLPQISQSAAGEMLNVSRDSVKRGVKVDRHGIDELKQAVETGVLKVTTAARIAQLPKPEQAAAIVQAQQPREVKPKPTPVPPEVDDKELDIEEAVGKSEEVSKPRILGVGVEKAHEAIAILSRIPINDPLRRQGHEIVMGYIRTCKY